MLEDNEASDRVGPPSLCHALAVLAPGATAFCVGKPSKTVEINHFHAASGHLNEFLLRETAKMQGISLVGNLKTCVGCGEAKLRHAPVPRSSGSRAAVPFGRIHIDLAGPFQPALDGSIYLIMFVDSASRWQRLYGMRAKSETMKYVRRFLSDMNGMGTLGSFRTDNGGEFTGKAFIEFCDAAGIRREYTAPDTPKQNGVAESAIWRAFKGGHAARRHIASLPHVNLATVPNMDRDGNRLWLSSAIWASGCFNRSATTANKNCKSPYECFFGKPPPIKIIPFFQPGLMRVKRRSKMDVQAVPCYYLHGSNNHSISTHVVLRADTGRMCLTSSVLWARDGLPPASPPSGGGELSAPAAPSEPTPDIISFGPAAQAGPEPTAAATSPSLFADSADAPSPIREVRSSATSSVPTITPSHSPLTIRAKRELDYGKHKRLHGRTRRDGLRFMEERLQQPREPPPASPQPPSSPSGSDGSIQHRLGLLSMMDKTALISSLATRDVVEEGRRAPPKQSTVRRGQEVKKEEETKVPLAIATLFATRQEIDAAIREERPPGELPDLPNCYASDIKTPKTFKEAKVDEYADIWLDSVHREFKGLVDSGTFEPV